MLTDGGIYGLGWALFLYMMIDRRFERKEYSKLVMRILDFYGAEKENERDISKGEGKTPHRLLSGHKPL
jgi:hypothetical protein